MFNVPEGYALISEEMLRLWGKLEEVEEMCPVQIVEPYTYTKAGNAHYMPGAKGFTMVCFKSSDVPDGTEVYILKGNNV